MKTLQWLMLAWMGTLPAYADTLPDRQAAEAALWASPTVAQARGELAAQTLRSEGLRRGRAEWMLSADVAQRRIDTPADRQAEWGMAVSRPLRLPARAAADSQLATTQVAYARASLGEALHESGRQLLALWFDWLGESSQADLWQAQVQLAERQLAAVNTRIRLGESPRADRVSAEALLAHARLQQQQAGLRLKQAASRVQARYPGVPLQADTTLPEPAPPAGTAQVHADVVMAHNHELARARREADTLHAEARQLAGRRSADPSVGVFYKNEVGGMEHVLGLNVALTLPGAARRTDQQAVEALGSAASVRAQQLEARLRAEAQSDFEAATALAAQEREASRAAGAQETAAQLAARAYELGEGSFDQVLLSRRLAHEARLLAQQLRVATLAADARLRLDAHSLWPLDVDEDGHVHP